MGSHDSNAYDWYWTLRAWKDRQLLAARPGEVAAEEPFWRHCPGFAVRVLQRKWFRKQWRTRQVVDNVHLLL